MIVEHNVPLQQHNSFGIVAGAPPQAPNTRAAHGAALDADAQGHAAPQLVGGGGSNIVLYGDVKPVGVEVGIKGG